MNDNDEMKRITTRTYNKRGDYNYQIIIGVVDIYNLTGNPGLNPSRGNVTKNCMFPYKKCFQ